MLPIQCPFIIFTSFDLFLGEEFATSPSLKKLVKVSWEHKKGTLGVDTTTPCTATTATITSQLQVIS
jgi:hypothetical protein